MPVLSTSVLPRQAFAGALAAGLVWGIAAAAAISGLAMALLVPGEGLISKPELLVGTISWTVLAATALAIFPIGPSAALLGWRLYRDGVVARSAYAAVGAVSAFTAPMLVMALALWDPSSMFRTGRVDGVAMILIACFPVVGAFAGFMAGRAIQRGVTAAQDT